MSNIKCRTAIQQQIIAQIEINILFVTKRERNKLFCTDTWNEANYIISLLYYFRNKLKLARCIESVDVVWGMYLGCDVDCRWGIRLVNASTDDVLSLQC